MVVIPCTLNVPSNGSSKLKKGQEKISCLADRSLDLFVLPYVLLYCCTATLPRQGKQKVESVQNKKTQENILCLTFEDGDPPGNRTLNLLSKSRYRQTLRFALLANRGKCLLLLSLMDFIGMLFVKRKRPINLI